MGREDVIQMGELMVLSRNHDYEAICYINEMGEAGAPCLVIYVAVGTCRVRGIYLHDMMCIMVYHTQQFQLANRLLHFPSLLYSSFPLLRLFNMSQSSV
jgi:hypothetical protein